MTGELVAQAAACGGGSAHRGGTGAPPRAHRAEEDERADEQADAAVSPFRPERVAHHRAEPAAHEDRQCEDRDPPGHEPGALVVVVGHLGRHRDVGHLEERVGRRAGHEEHDHPGGGDAGGRGRSREEEDEGDREQGTRTDEEGTTTTRRVGRPVADPTCHGVQHDVPRLGEEDDEARETGGHPEPVGEVGQEQEAGHGAERAGGDRSQAVPSPGRRGEGRRGSSGGRRCHVGTLVRTMTAWVRVSGFGDGSRAWGRPAACGSSSDGGARARSERSATPWWSVPTAIGC